MLIHRFFTANPRVANSKLAQLQAELDGLTAFVRSQGQFNARLETQISELREEIAAFNAALHKLRGQVHGPRAQEVKREPREPAFPPLTTKEALRRRAGIVAGQPAPHGDRAERAEDQSYGTGD